MAEQEEEWVDRNRAKIHAGYPNTSFLDMHPALIRRKRHSGTDQWLYYVADLKALASLPQGGRSTGRYRSFRGIDTTKPLAPQMEPKLELTLSEQEEDRDTAALFEELGIAVDQPMAVNGKTVISREITIPQKAAESKLAASLPRLRLVTPKPANHPNKVLFDWIESGLANQVLSPAQAIAILREKLGG